MQTTATKNSKCCKNCKWHNGNLICNNRKNEQYSATEVSRLKVHSDKFYCNLHKDKK